MSALGLVCRDATRDRSSDFFGSSFTKKPKGKKAGTKKYEEEEEEDTINDLFAEPEKNKDENVWKPKGSFKDICDSLDWISTHKLSKNSPSMSKGELNKSYINLSEHVDDMIDEWIIEMREKEDNFIDG
jgi:hypothetical protein